MSRLDGAEHADVVALSRNLLADDIAATAAETEDAYRTLCEKAVIEPVEYLPTPENPDYFLVRLAVLGDNETKCPRPYKPESFGPSLREGRPLTWR